MLSSSPIFFTRYDLSIVRIWLHKNLLTADKPLVLLGKIENSLGKIVFSVVVSGQTITVGAYSLKVLFCKITHGLLPACTCHFLGSRFAIKISYLCICMSYFFKEVNCALAKPLLSSLYSAYLSFNHFLICSLVQIFL